MIVKEFNTLPEDAVKIRMDVFVVEQEFEEEIDDIDSFATHILMYDNDKPIAVCRFFYDDNKQAYKIGRVAVVKEYRNKNIGSKIMAEAEKRIRDRGASFVMLSAQILVKDF